MFGIMDGASIDVDLSKPLTEETKHVTRASLRAQLEANGVPPDLTEAAIAKLDALFADWTPAGFFATSLEQMADMVGSRVTFAQGCKDTVERIARGAAEQAGAAGRTIFELGCISACMTTAAMMMDVAATRMRELAAEVRDDKPEAAGQA